MSTNVLSAKDIKRDWHLIDAKEQILGRLAGSVAKLLMGKHKPNFVPYLDTGDYVVIINASKIKVTGNKKTQKKYVRHSGYPGGLKVEIMDEVLNKAPEKILEHAIKGMLPKNKLGRVMVKKLYVFASEDHPFKNRIKEN